MRLVLWISLLGAGCNTFTAPTEEALAALQPAAPSDAFRATATVTIESDSLRGTFDALLVAEPAVPRVRLQLFPDLGGVVLDLIATPERFVGEVGDQSIDCAPVDAPRSLLTFLGFTLLEMFHPVTPDRVRGQRRTDDGFEFDVVPAAGDLTLHVVPHGRMRFCFRGVPWVLEERLLRARGFSLRVDDVAREPAQPKPGVFVP